MKRTETLNQNRDFVRLYRRGQNRIHPLLVSYGQKNRGGSLRMGVTATKKIGGAVQRNRAKRLIREAYRQLEPGIPAGWDFVFVARGRTTTAKMPQVKAAMEQHILQLTAPGKKGGKA